MKLRTVQNYIDIMISKANSIFEYRINWKIAIWFKALIYGLAEAVFTAQRNIGKAVEMLFPQTAIDEFLDMFGGWEGLEKLTGSVSEGYFNITGDSLSAGVSVPISTSVQSASGILYETTEAGVITEQTKTILTLVISGGICTVETTTPHGYANGQKPVINTTILGVPTTLEPEGIVVLTNKIFQFETDESAESSVVGTTFDRFCTVKAESVAIGYKTNTESGESMRVADDIDHINEECYVFSDFINGRDVEEQEDWRSRIMLSRKQTRGVFTDDQIVLAGLRISGNTRIFVDKPVLGAEDPVKVAGFQPVAGETVAYVVRDLPDGTIETPVPADIINDTKTSIIEYGKLPANMPVDSLYVFGILLEYVNFSFTSITPDTATMRAAVENSIDAFFYDNASLENSLEMSALISAIQNTYDIETGEPLRSFVLASPTFLPNTPKNISVKGTVSF